MSEESKTDINIISEMKQKKFDELSDSDKIEVLQKQIEQLVLLVNRKGIENRGAFLLDLMGSNTKNDENARSAPLRRFADKILDEFHLLLPFIKNRGLPLDNENEAKFDIIRRKVMNVYHKDLRKEVSDLLRDYSIITIVEKTDRFNFKNPTKALYNGDQNHG